MYVFADHNVPRPKLFELLAERRELLLNFGEFGTQMRNLLLERADAVGA